MDSEQQRTRQIDYLTTLLDKYPEGKMLFGAAKASPEALPTLTKTSISRDIAARLHVPLDESAVEADRTFLAVLLFRAAVDGDKTYFPHLSTDAFDRLHEYVQPYTEFSYPLIEYSLLCNDLGKVAVLCNLFETDHGKPEPDHDTCLYSAVEHHADLFPGLDTLRPWAKQHYLEGLQMMTTLNLAQFVQGECLPPHLRADVTVQAKEFRLITEIFDFAGVTGSLHTKFSIVLTDATFDQYMTAINLLIAPNATRSGMVTKTYDLYMQYRLDMTNFDQLVLHADAPTRRVYGRLLCLTRETNTATFIHKALARLPDETRATIVAELAETCETRPGVLLYYLPAMFANALGAYTKMLAARANVTTTIPDVLATVLIRAADCYREARETGSVDPATNCITCNVAHVANELKTLFV